jgi:exodeoxyribonuclease-5
MDWSPQQEDALRKVGEWLRDPNAAQVFRLFGFAGTGKTTLARIFAQDVNGTVLFGAYTGKAAYVMRTKGCEGATTIHSLIYKSREKGDARLRELEKELEELSEKHNEDHPQIVDIQKEISLEKSNLKQPFFVKNLDSAVKEASLVVIDECSMVDQDMALDLLSFGTKVLVLGDPAQLPPVGGAGYFTENVTPDVMLTEVHRQAGESPIIWMATKVRNAESIPLGDYGNCGVIEKANPEMVFDYDQILVGKNKTRSASNKRFRNLLGRESPYPVVEDKLVCLRNNHEEGLLNGAIFHVAEVGEVDDRKILMSIRGENSRIVQEVLAHEHHMLGCSEELQWYERKDAQEFDYGYALTVHKSQGSQWDNVLLFDEAHVFRKDRWRWLYTGITRAAEKVTIVRM